MTDQPTPAVERLCAILRDRDWTTAREITLLSASPESARGWNRRFIARLADLAGGRILSTTRGYKLASAATHDEVMRCYTELTKKAEDTGRRASAVLAWYHRQRQHQDSDRRQLALL